MEKYLWTEMANLYHGTYGQNAVSSHGRYAGSVQRGNATQKALKAERRPKNTQDDFRKRLILARQISPRKLLSRNLLRSTGN